MDRISKRLSKTVQQRQLKKLRPIHHEILTRYLKGQRLGKISSAVGIGRQWLSVIINSPVSQDELETKFQKREQEVIKSLSGRRARVLEGLRDRMRYGVESPSRVDSEILDRLRRKIKAEENAEDGLGEIIIRELSRMKKDSEQLTSQEVLPEKRRQKAKKCL